MTFDTGGACKELLAYFAASLVLLLYVGSEV